MLRKRIFYAFLLISNIFLYAQEQNIEIDIHKYQNIIITLLANFSNIVKDNQISENVYSTFILSDSAIRNNDVSFKIDPKIDTILGGMSFGIHESGEISLFFGLQYLDTYMENSSIHYSILIHEYRHLHDYLKDKTAFINAKTNEKEKYWYELDALRIEAEFIKYYLAGKYNLSRFENYLLYSFENNNLNTASIFIKRESMNFFFYFNNMETMFAENKITKEEIIIELEQVGYRLLNSYRDDDEDYINFIRFIEISTFRKYLIRLLTIILNSPEMTWEEVFEKYYEIGEIYENMSKIISNHNSKQTQYLSSLFQSWEYDIINRN